MPTSNLARAAATIAAAAATVTLAAGTAGALQDGDPGTLDALHKAGCVPAVNLHTGANTVAYRGGGQDACRGQHATIVYDTPAGITTRIVDLGQGVIQVDPPCGITAAQVDLFAGDVTGQIAAPGWNPAWRLITVSWLDGAPCIEPPTTVTFATTPAPAPTFPEPTIPPTVDEPLLPPATTVLEPPTTTVVPPAPELPVTGRNPIPLTVTGLSLVAAGTMLARRYRRR